MNIYKYTRKHTPLLLPSSLLAVINLQLSLTCYLLPKSSLMLKLVAGFSSFLNQINKTFRIFELAYCCCLYRSYISIAS